MTQQSTLSSSDMAAKLNDILVRAATDLDLRAKLIGKPAETLSAQLGITFPAGFTVEVVESKADETIVLPPAMVGVAELPEHELEAVAGGTSPALSIAASVYGVAQTVVMGTAVISAVFTGLNWHDDQNKPSTPPPDNSSPDDSTPANGWVCGGY